jgi:hypothetical protein
MMLTTICRAASPGKAMGQITIDKRETHRSLGQRVWETNTPGTHSDISHCVISVRLCMGVLRISPNSGETGMLFEASLRTMVRQNWANQSSGRE